MVSTSDEAGEGEHEIFAHIRNSSTYKSKLMLYTDLMRI